MSAPDSILAQAKAVLDYLEAVTPSDAPRPGHFVIEDPPISVTCFATMFGLNWDGSIDTQDNGQGFFGYDTRDKGLYGCSLPREVMLSTFGISDDWRSSPIGSVWAQHAGEVRSWVFEHKPLLTVDCLGHTLQNAPLVDAGPAAGTSNGMDLTYAAAHLLDTQGRALVTYKITINGTATSIKGWNFSTRRVG